MMRVEGLQLICNSLGGLHRLHEHKGSRIVSASSGVTGPSRRGILLAALLAAGASLLLLWLPVYASESAVYSMEPSGTESSVSVRGRATLLEVNGPDAWPPLAIPVAIAVVPLLVPGASRRRVAAHVCAGTLVLFVILGGFSIGAFYAPSAIAMVLAIARRPGRQAAA